MKYEATECYINQIYFYLIDMYKSFALQGICNKNLSAVWIYGT